MSEYGSDAEEEHLLDAEEGDFESSEERDYDAEERLLLDAEEGDFESYEEGDYDAEEGDFESSEEADYDAEEEERRLLDKFKGKLSCQRPTSSSDLWVLWSSTDHLSRPPASSSINSVEIIKDKIRSALQHMKYNTSTNILVQFWGRVINDGRCFLTTSDQPFGVGRYNRDICLYRKYSEEYKFNVEEDLGFPARVFRQNWPESTPSIRFYSRKDHPWWHRLCPKFWNVLALPVFGRTSGHCCIGVLEVLVMEPWNSMLMWCIVQAVLRALERVDLKCCYVEACHHFDKQGQSQDLQHALDEIINMNKVMCETHKLPSALTWVPCRQCSDVAYGRIPEKNRTSSDVNSARELMSTIYDASYGGWKGLPMDLQLQKGQGVAGRAYLSHNSCFCNDVTQFSLSDYPLAHHARQYGLAGSFAICLRSSYTREDDYILEFFLPSNVTNEYTGTLLDSILATMRQHLSSFKLASGEELGVELSVEAITFSTVKKSDSFQICQTTRCPPMPEALQNGGEMVQPDSSDEQLMVEDDAAINNGRNTVTVSANAVNNSGTRRTLKKTIPLVDIEPHFGKNLEDVAELFDVSRSTFKRICRGHGIMRWRKHKRNKVNGSSLSKRGPPCSNLPPKQAVATVDHTMPHVTAMQNVRTLTIKAKYKENTIKFGLSSSAGKEDLEQEITKRLKLKVGSFNIHYLDEDDDWYLVTCGDVLQDCMSDSATTIRMKVQPVTN